MKAQEARRNKWISAETWRIVDEIVTVSWDPAKGLPLKRRLGRAIKASLAADRRRHTDASGAEVEALVGSGPTLI